MADELRRAYHDRIGDVRSATVAIVATAVDALVNVTPALVDVDRPAATEIQNTVGSIEEKVGKVEREVMELLAQQAPVARDLRVLLASLRVAQVGHLCLGLVSTIASRVGQSIPKDLGPIIRDVGACTSELLEQAGAAWIVLDPDEAKAVRSAADGCRELQRQFLAGLLRLPDVPIEIGLDLGLLARAYERLTDHAVEIAERAEFAALG